MMGKGGAVGAMAIGALDELLRYVDGLQTFHDCVRCLNALKS